MILDDIDRELCMRGQYQFFGLPMDQAPNALRAINVLLMHARPHKIIEFGTGRGGLSVLLSLYASVNGIQFTTYDNSLYDQHIQSHLQNPTSFRWTDLNSDAAKEEIKHSILQATRGPVILFCDALKSVEFSYYADFCKPGDFLLVHDYAHEKGGAGWQEACAKTGWSAPQEQWYANIEQACLKNHITPFMAAEFEAAFWYCGVKTTPTT